ncbi:MAG: asparagine synthase (glutamine-hydrolyzing) [Planctomycetota bacterium]
MCGIVGVLNRRGDPVDPDLIARMTSSIAHRGPDGTGQWTLGEVGLGHRRLAIIDLSSAASQPMRDPAQANAVVYNGEIYNFRELRGELEALGHAFRSASDTEVLVHAYDEWGPSCVDRLNGMFAFAIWDGRRRTLFLARDRYGVKPLYWWQSERSFAFASEVKALLLHPAMSRAVCHEALDEYFAFQNIFTDRTLFAGVRLLPPGCVLEVSADDLAIEQRRFWDFRRSDPLRIDEAECGEQFFALFSKAVTRQLVSDVPVGAYLSGGLDSASIVGVASRQLRRLTTFTGGFDLSSVSGLELGFDERANAEVLANLFKTEHYEVVLHAGDMEWVLPELVDHLEDLRVGQCYPNYYVSRLASRFVKVVLSGVGGDELLGGYPWRYYRGFGRGGREEYFRRYYEFWQRLVPDADKPRLFNARTRAKVGDQRAYDIFRGVFDGWPGEIASNEDCVDASLYFELKTFLPGLLLVEDKLSMAHGLETRVPFLDNELVDFVTRLPARHKLAHLDQAPAVDENLPGKRYSFERKTNDGKLILRSAMSRLLPRDTTARIKQGFSAPDATWFRGESVDYVNRLLRDPKARIYEYVERDYVTEVLDLHCSGRVNKRLMIWSLLCFEWWLDRFMK